MLFGVTIVASARKSTEPDLMIGPGISEFTSMTLSCVSNRDRRVVL